MNEPCAMHGSCFCPICGRVLEPRPGMECLAPYSEPRRGSWGLERMFPAVVLAVKDGRARVRFLAGGPARWFRWSSLREPRR